jgi:hypothetical protein
MMKTNVVVSMALLILVVALVGCGGGRTVTRLDTEGVTDLSGKWNETDARLVAEEMINDCLRRTWVTDFVTANGRKPVVTVARIRNNTSEHIDAEIFTTDFERELINSGQVKFVAAKVEREDIQDEQLYQGETASAATMARISEQTGADFVLLGSIKLIVDQASNDETRFYQTDLDLVNVESAEKVWVGTKKIKKGVAKSSKKW